MTFPKYPFFSEKGYKLTKTFTPARTYLGLGIYGTYKDFGEESWKIGYGSLEINGHFLIFGFWWQNFDTGHIFWIFVPDANLKR